LPGQTEKTTKDLEQNSQLLGWDFNLGCFEQEKGVPTAQTKRLK
jgi:hypothetical protein